MRERSDATCCIQRCGAVEFAIRRCLTRCGAATYTLTEQKGGRMTTPVMHSCRAHVPEVDLWEAGHLYPSWANTARLAALTETPLAELLRDDDEGIQLPYARCGQHVIAAKFRRRYLPGVVSLSVSEHPKSASITAARQIASQEMEAQLGLR